MSYIFTVSGPEDFLMRAYADRIAEIHEAFESAIKTGHLETELTGSEKYLDIGVYIEKELFPIFERMYVTEGGWAHLSDRYETARLYLTW